MIDRSSGLGHLFHQYLEQQRAFLTVAQRCSIKGWPERTAALVNAWRLQCLYNEMQSLRFDDLLSGGGFREFSGESMPRISDRVVEEWTDAEEQALRDRNPRYGHVLADIAPCLAALDGGAIQEPLEAARRDPDYEEALQALQEQCRALDALLAGSYRR